MACVSLFVHRPAECGGGEAAKGKSSAGTRKTDTSDLSFKTTPFKTAAVSKMTTVSPHFHFMYTIYDALHIST